MAASRMCQGVTKSGSPMPSEMTPDIDWTISKKSRMPERGMARTCSATKSLGEVMETGGRGRCMAVRLGGGRSGADLGALVGFDLVAQDALLVVGLAVEMGGGRGDAGQ